MPTLSRDFSASTIDQLDQEIAVLECQFNATPLGPKRDDLRCQIDRKMTARDFQRWMNSPGLRPPN
jgi:hypothetical protein